MPSRAARAAALRPPGPEPTIAMRKFATNLASPKMSLPAILTCYILDGKYAAV